MANNALSYALVFDGWSEDSTHFIGLFIVYPAKEHTVDPEMHLLVFVPLLDETNFTAENHANFIKATLNWYSLSFERLFCLIGDNCSTNKAIANILGVPLLGCRSHRLNLAIEGYLSTFLATESKLVGKLMSKLATLKQLGRLCLMTSLHPIKQNDTCWTGIPDMFKHFEILLPNLDEDDEIMDLIPIVGQKRNIRECKQALSDFKSVTIALLQCDMSMNKSDVVFQSIIDSYLEFNFEDYLGKDADIIHNKPLKTAILKIQSNKENNLTNIEKNAVQRLLLPATQNVQEVEDDGAQLSFAERALKRQRVQEIIACSKYINTHFLLATSCVVERLFSMAKRVFSPHWHSMHPRTLETLLFLNQNKSLWNLALVALIVNERDVEAADDDQAEEEELEHDS